MLADEYGFTPQQVVDICVQIAGHVAEVQGEVSVLSADVAAHAADRMTQMPLAQSANRQLQMILDDLRAQMDSEDHTGARLELALRRNEPLRDIEYEILRYFVVGLNHGTHT